MNHSSHKYLLKYIFCSRIVVLLGMVLSSAILPTFDPGDDVMKFDLRLNGMNDQSKQCFCLEGHICDPLWRERRFHRHHIRCADQDRADYSDDESTGIAIKRWSWRLLLMPLTRWDASRFLSLATDPWMRFPETAMCYEEHCEATNHNAASEQAHAFFPLYPLIIREFALTMHKILPEYMLPPTFESLLVLSGLMWNLIAFTIATLELFNLTVAIVSSVDTQKSKKSGDVQEIALKVALAFCFNPANVFFVSCYSECTFCALTFSAYSNYERSKTSSHKVQRTFFFSFATACFFLGSFCRSNGIVSVLFLIINWCGDIMRAMIGKDSKHFFPIVWKTFCYLSAIIAVLYPFVHHDKDGLAKHCHHDFVSEVCSTAVKNNFSLYGYVQLKYWNVGLFRYYQLKQVPNFLLASPIIILSSLAVGKWILLSWSRWKLSCQKKGRERQISSLNCLSAMIRKILQWAFFSLSEMETDEFNCDEVLLGRRALPHYAVLCAYVLIGTCLSHVQITTRLVASSCPSFYWFVVHLLLLPTQNSTTIRKNMLKWYFLLFNILGCILHTTWLPWT